MSTEGDELVTPGAKNMSVYDQSADRKQVYTGATIQSSAQVLYQKRHSGHQ